MAQDVKMVYLRPGKEYVATTKARRTALSLRDEKHKTTHTPEDSAIWAWPPLEKPYESLDAFWESDPPPLTTLDNDQGALFEEWSFWEVEKTTPRPCPTKPDDELTPEELALINSDPRNPSRLHDELILPFFGKAYRLNGVVPASKAPTPAQAASGPMHWGAGISLAVGGSVIAIMAVMFFLGG